VLRGLHGFRYLKGTQRNRSKNLQVKILIPAGSQHLKTSTDVVSYPFGKKQLKENI